ncbi:MAG: ATP-dependent endonuclease [Muribaculaceae bacterium]|nr:ATP-dependent endonuclease [Muribaculaceae bacterium]
MEDLKFKPLTKEQILISIDRLTRFKDTETKYVRVFCDILTSNLIFPKFKRNELEQMDYCRLKDMAEYIINSSIESVGCMLSDDYVINQRLYDYEKSVFSFGKDVEYLLKNKISYQSILGWINDDSVKNLKWLKILAESVNIEDSRQKYSLRFPVKKVVIAEGATEETLLPEFAKLCGYDFDKEGVYMLSAGGKNQVVKLFYKLYETLKLPIFVLLDNDANENFNQIKPKLRKGDKIHLLNCGEFEDLLPKPLVKRALDYELSNISMLEQEMLNEHAPMVKILEEVFKTRGLHEFKKVEFSKSVKKNILDNNDISPEIKCIIDEIRLVGEIVT